MGAFKEPHGGELKNLYLPREAVEDEQSHARDLPSWDLSMRQLCDLELLLNGAFSPLEGFMGADDYNAVLAKVRLADGVLWPIPITLDVTEAFADSIEPGVRIALRDQEGVLIATLNVDSKFRPDKKAEALAVFGSADEAHPAVHYLNSQANDVYLGGRLTGVEPPRHYDFKHLRDSPAQIRERFEKLGWRRVVAFQTRNPMHRAHQELTFRAAREMEVDVLSNYTGEVHEPDAEAIRSRLFFQLFNPVRWLGCMNTALDRGVDTIVEFGGGIGEGEGPADRRANLENIVKKTLKIRKHEATYLPAINSAGIYRAAEKLSTN